MSDMYIINAGDVVSGKMATALVHLVGGDHAQKKD